MLPEAELALRGRVRPACSCGGLACLFSKGREGKGVYFGGGEVKQHFVRVLIREKNVLLLSMDVYRHISCIFFISNNESHGKNQLY